MTEIAEPLSSPSSSEKYRELGRAFRRADSTWTVLAFILVALQFALLVLLLVRFKLETQALRDVAQIAFAGFLVHHFLPGKWRLPFFLALSIGATAYVLGLDEGRWRLGLSVSRVLPLLAIGFILIGICHLPFRWGVRILLLVLAGGLLAWVRSNWFAWSSGSGEAAWIWPVLGSMFMFRLLVYFYDVQHEKGPAQPVRALSYFFLLPNVCFTLFPVIDYKTFCRTYYNDAALHIYQRGLGWMTRGIIHLLLWRIIYYEFYIDPSRVADGTDLVSYIVSNMALYLRVSGQFHLAIGLLLLFGFNLPETNRRYFLADGFTDYWRRVNIYWKDFIMKLFYYPAVFRLKAWGATRSVIAATVFAFVVTWLLHSYQTFWVRGDFPVRPQDAIFWGVLCALVIASSLHEMKKGRTRSLGSVTVSWKDNLNRGWRTAGTFLVLSLLWSLWTCDSLRQWLELWEVADGDTVLWGSVTLAVIFLASVVVEGSWRKAKSAADQNARSGRGALTVAMPFPFRRAIWTCIIPATILLMTSVQRFHVHLSPDTANLVSYLFETRPNTSDEENMVRGYYEELMDVPRANPMLGAAEARKPKDWGRLEETNVFREVADYRMNDLAPSRRIILNGRSLSTNRWGMRDQDYPLAKSPGVYRIAMLGSSTVMGLNVNDGETFESLIEERLNEERAGRPFARYEILNFAVNGYNPPQQTVVLEKKVLDFDPDAVVLVVHAQESYFTIQRFAKSLRKGIEPIDEVFRRTAQEANVDARTPDLRAEKRLGPYWPRLMEWAFWRIAERCRQEGIRAAMVYLPGIGGIERDRTKADLIIEMARKVGFATINLEYVFAHAAPETLIVAPWDKHANAVGHRLIADGLFAALTAESGGLLGPAKASSDRANEQTGKRGN